MDDWSHYRLEADRYLTKVHADLLASQSCGPSAEQVALVQADTHLCLAIAELVNMREAVRKKRLRNG